VLHRPSPSYTVSRGSQQGVETSRGVYFRCRVCGSLAVLAAAAEPSIRCTTCGFDDHALYETGGRRRGRLGEITIGSS
jgi:ribosomal protein S27E